MPKNYGFIAPIPDPRDWVLGDANFKGAPLQPNGQWDDFLPADEFQSFPTFDPAACATFGTFNCLEIILKSQFAVTKNFSDRYTAKITGTDKLGGNDPQTIIESIRKQGAVKEEDYPNYNVSSFQEYYQEVPQYLENVAKLFPIEWQVQHDYVPSDPKALKEALKYSPLGIGVAAWWQDGDYYYRPQGAQSNHWCVLYGYVEGEYWKVFDTYDNSHKKLKWDYRFDWVKRYAITPVEYTPQKKSAAILFLQSLVALLTKVRDALLPPKPAPLPISKIPEWALAIQHEEGGKPQDHNIISHNPGNLKFTPYTASLGGLKGATASDGGYFCRFPTYQDGFKALSQFLTDACTGKLASYKPSMSLDAFTQTYANPPKSHPYASNVAQKLAVPVSTPIRELL